MGKKSREKQQQRQAVQLNNGLKDQLVQDIMKQPVLFQWLTLFAFIGLCVLLFYPPYMRAMFFTSEQLPTHLLTYAIFLLWWAVKYQRKDFTFLREPLDYLIFAFVLAYVLSFTVAINTRGAIQEFLKVSNYFLVYWLVAQLSQVRKGAGLLLLNILLLSALGVAVLGLGAAAGTWEVTAGYVGGRIFSTIQYPNSLAAYLTGAFIVCLGLWQTAAWKLRQLYTVAAFLLLITAILTYSRGGWLIMMFFFFFYPIFLPRGRRLDAALFIGLVSLVSVGLTPFVGRLALAAQSGRLWFLVFAGCLIVLAGQYLLVDFRKRLSPKFLLTVAGILALLLFGTVGGYVYRTLAAPLRMEQAGIRQLIAVMPEVEYNLSMEVLPAHFGDAPFAWQLTVLEQRQDASVETLLEQSVLQLQEREVKEFTFTTSAEAHRILVQLQSTRPGTVAEFREVTLAGADATFQLDFVWNRLFPNVLYERLFGLDRERNVAERFVFFSDAWEIIKDYPWRGLGGHAWSSIYFKYRSAPYNTTEVHNHFLQVWIETGIIGFLLFVGIWKWFVFMSYRLYKQTDAEQKILVLAVATAVLAVVTHSLYDFNLSLGAIGIFVFALMGVNRSFMQKPALSVGRNQMYKPVLAVAITLVMMLFVVRLMIGNTAFEQGGRQLQFRQFAQARTTFERAVRHDPFNPRIRLALAEIYESHGAQTQNDDYLFKAKDQYRAAFRNNRNPFFANTLGNFLIRLGLHDEGLDYLRQAIALDPGFIGHYRHYATGYLSTAFFSFRNNDPTAGQRYLEGVFATGKQVQELFDDRNAIALALGQAYFMLSDYEQSLMHLAKALNVEDDKAHASMMLALVYEKNGDSARHQELFEQAMALNPASEGTYQAFKNFLRE